MTTVLPPTWQIQSLEDINDCRKRTINPHNFPDELFEYYSIPAYQEGVHPALEYGREINSVKLLLETGTILFGKLNPRVEKVWRVENDTPHRKIGSTEWLPISPAAGIDANFVYYLQWSEHVMPFAKQQVSGSTPSRQRVDPSSFYGIKVPIPPLPEQRRIAAVLSLVQKAIEQQERLIALTTELKKALMHKLFTEGTRGESQKQTEIGRIPESWEVVELNTITRIERGKFGHRPRNEPRFYGGDIPFVQTGDVSNCDGHIREYNQTLNEDGLAISRMFPAGTILITIAANIGYTGILCFDSACPDSLIAITPNDDVEAQFLNYYLTTQQPVMDRLAPRGTQKNINIQFLKPWPIPLPGKKEQLEIAAILGRVATKHRKHAATKDTLSDLFRTLLHQLMTAEIRVNDLDLEELGLDGEK
jgi:type I restriction enzyme S subunit